MWTMSFASSSQNRERSTLELLNDQETHSPAASRGHSVVLKAELEGLEPLVVKLAPAARIRRERRCHDRHVLDQLGGHFHARLIRDVKFWDLGGAVYNFLGSPRKKLPTFGTFYRQQTDSRAILVPLRHFFEEVWRRHYDHLSKKQPTSLLELYDRSLHLKRKLKKVSFEENLAELSASFGVPLIDPVAWVLGRGREAPIPMVRQATTHGDLHGDNLFVDGEHAWAIDFERTGPGHILRDFVELEADIVTRLTLLPDEDPGLLRDFVIAMAAPDELSATLLAARRVWENPETRKALDVIGALRKLAHELTGCSDTQEYLWGLLLDALVCGCAGTERFAATETCPGAQFDPLQPA